MSAKILEEKAKQDARLLLAAPYLLAALRAIVEGYERSLQLEGTDDAYLAAKAAIAKAEE